MCSLSRVACVRACEWAFISIALQDKRFLPHGKDKALNHTSQQEVCPALLVPDLRQTSLTSLQSPRGRRNARPKFLQL